MSRMSRAVEKGNMAFLAFFFFFGGGEGIPDALLFCLVSTYCMHT